MRFEDVWIAGTGGTHGELVPIEDAVAEGSYERIAADSTGMITVSQSRDAAPEMAVTAGRQALKESAELGVEVGPDAQVLHGCAGFQGIDMWSAAAWIGGELLGTRLDCLPTTVQAWSNGSLASLAIAANTLTARPEVPATLITVADRFAPPTDRYYASPGMVFGDGGAAAVVTRGGGRLRLLSCVAETDTVLGGLSMGDEKFRPAPPGEPPDARRRTREFLARGEVSLRDVQQRSAERTRSVVSRALAEAGLSTERVDWFVPPFVGRMLYREAFVRPSGVTVHNTLLDLGLTIGHLGAGDGLFALNHLISAGLLEPGAHVLLIGTGMGFTFSAAVLAASRG
ncbi:ketoacyl-ACP synthase III family protein [Amycolatopsis cihanbeyliensis]|uniref:3-oxoacyl-[acyl-carrier-protein] synthase-3 n=1 Tax=Amycolatopsis cihanbeyliensis TaxID=1128664 RepID=A0A542DPV6_AMYCI|nr:ketoacyl-ACP synthase III family protein [Amycolatopsis cihanbeyliensis]TQJ05140.1 3-oxoacyl-[acyl-carrier-protein] synthase-3 [Amycolatopsis cihanbeyliensis]